jgi:hypothetical protein
MWTLISYLYLDVLELGSLQAGLRLSTVLFSGLAAAVSTPLLDKAYVDSRSSLLQSTESHLELSCQFVAAFPCKSPSSMSLKIRADNPVSV